MCNITHYVPSFFFFITVTKYTPIIKSIKLHIKTNLIHSGTIQKMDYFVWIFSHTHLTFNRIMTFWTWMCMLWFQSISLICYSNFRVKVFHLKYEFVYPMCDIHKSLLDCVFSWPNISLLDCVFSIFSWPSTTGYLFMTQ